jgi:signal transduction histidine kinase
LALLRRICERLAYVSGASLPPEFPETMAGSLQLLDSLSGICEKKLERAARNTSDDAARLGKLKTQFLRRVSHELRTPLASIEGFGRLMLRDIEQVAAGKPAQTTFEVRREFLRVISQESHRLGDQIEKLLELSGLDPESAGPSPALFPAREAFLEAMLLFSSRYPDLSPKKVRLEVTPEPDGPTVFASRAAVRDILEQLLDNARKFSNGHEIVLGAEPVPAKPETGVPQTRLYVKDHGHGIPEDKLPALFNGLHCTDSNGSPIGAGLGLSLVKSLAEQNEGSVDAESKAGAGTTISVVLPAQPRSR